jgi:hypothetical protein
LAPGSEPIAGSHVGRRVELEDVTNRAAWAHEPPRSNDRDPPHAEPAIESHDGDREAHAHGVHRAAPFEEHGLAAIEARPPA